MKIQFHIRTQKAIRALLMICLANSVLGLPARAQVALTGQLLINPGAEFGDLTGWSQSGPVGYIVDDGSYEGGLVEYFPHSGSYQFVAGASTGTAGTLFQSVSLSSLLPTTLGLIDSGDVVANIGVWQQTLLQGGFPDYARISLEFFDVNASPLGSFTSPNLDAYTWQHYTASPGVPAGSRGITYSIESYRGVNGGNWIDAFTDDNSLILSTASSPVPEPSQWSAAALGILAFATVRNRRKIAKTAISRPSSPRVP